MTFKVSEQYKLSEWLSETRPRKSPYYPQIHDEIVYFVQGWLLYISVKYHGLMFISILRSYFVCGRGETKKRLRA